MPDYFAEKASQVDPDTLTAFGITISSRYGKADEIIEMLGFCRVMAVDGVSHLVKEVFYDSKADICSITFVESVGKASEVVMLARAAAKRTIRQFEIFGYIDHGMEFAWD